MSLQNLAYQVQSRGRDDDTMLVHMTPGEVQGLQALAMKHGGSLTINPETGLAEAGFLKQILPMVAGAALNAFVPGLGALGSAAIVGGVSALSSGDLGQGLLAGLGAYGGAQIGGAMGFGGAAAGAGAAGAQAATAAGATGVQSAGAITQAAGTQAAAEGAKQQVAQQVIAKEAAAEVAKKSALSSMSPYLYASAPLMAGALMEQPETLTAPPEPPANIRPYTMERRVNEDAYTDTGPGEKLYFNDIYRAGPVREAKQGGIMSLAVGGPAQTRITPDEFINQYLSPVRTVTKIPGGMSGYEGEYAPNTGGAVIAPVTDVGAGRGRGTQEFTDEFGKKYTMEYDPTTGEYIRMYLPEVEKAAPTPSATPEQKPDGGGSSQGAMTNAQFAAQQAQGARNLDALTTAAAQGLNFLGYTPETQAPAPVVDLSTPYGDSPSGVISSTPAPSSNPNVYSSSSSGYESSGGGGSYSGSSGVGDSGVSPGGGNAAGGYGYGGWKQGGVISRAQGGLAQDSFIIPADVMSALGNGSTKAGLAALNKQLQGRKAGGATLIQGAGDGLSDSIATHIGGKQPARVADGEAYIDPNTVKRLGAGSAKKGAAKLYEMMDNVRKQAHGKTTQQRKVNPAKAMG